MTRRGGSQGGGVRLVAILAMAAWAMLLSAACAARGPVGAASTRPVAVPLAAAAAGEAATTDSQSALPVPAAPESPALVASPIDDSVALLLARSDGYFEDGQRELREGRLDAASRSFALALELLSSSPEAARGEPRVVDQLDRLTAAIKASEVLAVAKQGDTLTEQPSVPAPRDALLEAARLEPLRSPPTPEVIELDVASTAFDIDVPLTPRVLSFVQMYTGNPRMRSFLEDGLSRGAKYLPMVRDIFRAQGIPLDLAYIPLVESAFKTSALSRAKARGIWQFMPGTGVEQGLQRDWYVDERADPEKATRAAARFLQQLYEQFGDWHLALASYNGGPGRVQGAIRRSGKNDYWAIRASARYLPRETRDYVPLILAAVIVARSPARYGLTITPAELPEVETVTLESPIDIRLVSLWTGRLLEEIQELNPELRRWTTPLRAATYELKVPAGTGDLVRARLAETPAEEMVPLDRRTVRKGDTLRTLARTLKVTQADLAEANYLSTRAKLQTGQRLIVPRPPALPVADDYAESLVAGAVIPEARGAVARPTASVAAAVATSPVTVARADVLEKPAGTVSSVTTPRVEAPIRRVHRVQRGDTLTSIARLYRTTVASLREWNRLSGSRIVVGQRLTILVSQALVLN